MAMSTILCAVAVLLLTVAVSPEVQVPPASGSNEENENGKQKRKNQRKFGAVLCRQIAGFCIEIKREGQQQARDQYESQQGQNRPRDAQSKIWNAPVLR